MRVLVLFVIGLLVAGNAAADRDRDRGGYHGYSKSYSYSLSKRSWRKSARRYASSRLNYLRSTSLNAGVCDELQGSSRGLRMMCIAFCELQSCSPDFTAEKPFESCSRSSKWIYNRYEKRRGAGDPEMPCVKQPAVAAACPCWSDAELASFRRPSSADPVATCTTDSSPAPTMQNFDNLQVSDGAGGYLLSMSSFGNLNGAPSCALTDNCSDGSCLGQTRVLPVDNPDALAACERDIAVAASGLTCN